MIIRLCWFSQTLDKLYGLHRSVLQREKQSTNPSEKGKRLGRFIVALNGLEKPYQIRQAFG